MRADYLEFHTGICRKVREFDLAQKADPVFRKGIRINHAGMVQDLLQETDTADCLSLFPPCFTLSRILAPIPLRAGLCDIFPHFRIDHVDKVLQLGRNLVVSLF